MMDVVSSEDVLICAIYYIKKISDRGMQLTDVNKLSVLWITCLLTSKYILAYDHEICVEEFANLGGYTIKQYIELEKHILRALDWKLEIPQASYSHFKKISEGCKLIQLPYWPIDRLHY
jgi:hypothetical protein